MTSKNNQENKLFANGGVLLTGRKGIPPPSSVAEETCRHPAPAIWPEAVAEHGFGSEENDWLGAEAYVCTLR